MIFMNRLEGWIKGREEENASGDFACVKSEEKEEKVPTEVHTRLTRKHHGPKKEITSDFK